MFTLNSMTYATLKTNPRNAAPVMLSRGGGMNTGEADIATDLETEKGRGKRSCF
jgi:hypothetical protein